MTFVTCVSRANSQDRLTTTALGEMGTQLRQPPFVPVEIESPGKYNLGCHEKESVNLHEAAYDAFVTGRIRRCLSRAGYRVVHCLALEPFRKRNVVCAGNSGAASPELGEGQNN